jgi:hypothetical protein
VSLTVSTTATTWILLVVVAGCLIALARSRLPRRCHVCRVGIVIVKKRSSGARYRGCTRCHSVWDMNWRRIPPEDRGHYPMGPLPTRRRWSGGIRLAVQMTCVVLAILALVLATGSR